MKRRPHLAFVIRRRVTFIVNPDILKLVHRPADRRPMHVLVPRALHPVTDDGDPVGVVACEPVSRNAQGRKLAGDGSWSCWRRARARERELESYSLKRAIEKRTFSIESSAKSCMCRENRHRRRQCLSQPSHE